MRATTYIRARVNRRVNTPNMRQPPNRYALPPALTINYCRRDDKKTEMASWDPRDTRNPFRYNVHFEGIGIVQRRVVSGNIFIHGVSLGKKAQEIATSRRQLWPLDTHAREVNCLRPPLLEMKYLCGICRLLVVQLYITFEYLS